MNLPELTLCTCCGQSHLPQENHSYNYRDEIDDDLTCDICLQPLVEPMDTPCGHTYCTLCLTNFLLAQDFCPMDRKPLCLMVCKKSSLLVHKLLDKAMVFCPFKEHCTEVLQRCDLEIHLRRRCQGAIQCGLSKEQEECPQEYSSADDTDSVPKVPVESSDVTAHELSPPISTPAAVALTTNDPGLINPAFETGSEDSHSESNCSAHNRSSIKKNRNFDRASVRSRSFKKLNRAFSYLRKNSSPNLIDCDPGESVQTSNLPDEEPSRLHHLIPDGEVTIIKIDRSDPQVSLGISIVGGCETPMENIVIQNIYREGAIAKDGRLLPGDMILEVNGTDLSNVPHNYALAVLKQPCQTMLLSVLREQLYKCRKNIETSCSRDDSFHVILHKSADQPLGIKLVRRSDESGVFIFSLLEGGLAAQDGQLQVDDRVLAINGHDLRRGSPEIAAHFIQISDDRVHFIVSRRTRERAPDILQESNWNSNTPPSPTQRNLHNKNFLHAFTCHEKIINVSKEVHESLGMTISGGLLSKGWDLPIYVANVHPNGCLGNDGRIKNGDILLNVNGIDLIGLTQSEAVSIIKQSATSSSITFKALELRVAEKDNTDGQISPNSIQNSMPEEEWSPLWNMWLVLPRYLYLCKDVELKRNTSGSLGFSIVGGYEENHGSQPFFIKSIVNGMPAHNDGRLRSSVWFCHISKQLTFKIWNFKALDEQLRWRSREGIPAVYTAAEALYFMINKIPTQYQNPEHCLLCGDVILAVNGRSTSGISHSCMVKILKEIKGKVTLTVASWPGTRL